MSIAIHGGESAAFRALRGTSRLSIGQRLAIGVVLFLLLLGAVGGFVVSSHQVTMAAERRFAEELEPLRASTLNLERSLLYVSLGLRSYLSEPTRPHLAQLREFSDRAVGDLVELGQLAFDDEAGRYHQQVELQVRDFLQRVAAIAERRRNNEPLDEEGIALAGSREVALARIRDFTELAQARAAAGRRAMIKARREANQSLALGALIGLVGFAAFSFMIARSIRRPARTLVRVAAAMEHGNWEPARALASRIDMSQADNDEMIHIARAFSSAATALRGREERLLALLAQVRQAKERIEEQNHQLSARRREIRQQNRSLHTQADLLEAQQGEIRAQNERLRVQHEELRARNDELLAQREMLALVDRRKTEFLAILAHELRNPMAPILASVHVLSVANPGGRETADARDLIARQVNHLARLVDDLLDVARISQGRIHVRAERMDLAATLATAVADCRAAIARRRLTVTLDAPCEPVWIEGDAVRICQVVGNLFGNAAKFTGDGGRIDVALKVERGAAPQAVITVRDSGVGMEPGVIRELFKPFSQPVPPPDRNNAGLGLGLSLVKALVELHGGTVTAHSDGKGKGALFTVRLPVAKEMAPPAVITSPVQHVLVIDDNDDVAQSLAIALGLEAFDVRIAGTGPDALRMAAESRPDAVLCDIGLPGMDGYEVAKRLRADERTRSILLVALSGHTQNPELSVRAGFDAHLGKPVGIDRVIALLRGTMKSQLKESPRERRAVTG